jgi:hypothetical protein
LIRIGLRIARFASSGNGVFPQKLNSSEPGDQPVSITTVGPKYPAGSFWSARREASLNWLALGLLLAAWNASDNDAPAGVRATPETLRPRPEALRGYSYVSVRAAQRIASVER